MRRFSTAVTITDPLVKYKSLVSTGIYAPDPAQHRLAHHLQKIYLRIKDYTPQNEYRERLNQVARLTERKPPEEDDDGRILALRHHSIWRNPLFKHLLSTQEGRDSLAMTRVLTNYETAIEIDSPKGLFLSGEVGTGKSMLLDLLADGLPTEKKRRWHFNTFMLHAFSQLEAHRKSRPYDAESSASKEAEYSILWLGKKLVDESPILFLDEFQLPDRAASKILSHLFIAFFQLGGVLIASSNRMPEELQKATGLDYAPAPTHGLIRRIFGGRGMKGELYGQSSDFANFLEVLKARCDFWQMEGTTDWRRRGEMEEGHERLDFPGSVAIGEVVSEVGDEPTKEISKRPRHYFLSTDENDEWSEKVKSAASWRSHGPIPWQPSDLIVYGRKVHTPNCYAGCVYWDFEKLVESFGPADYITMASSYHTFIIDNVPILTLTLKNEARRLITLLDALYEARCKLLIRAQSPPDLLFFPQKPAQTRTVGSVETAGVEGDDATYSETIAEVYQDQMSPFRPNVSYYDTANPTSTYDPDQDSDFGLLQQQQQNRPVVDFGNTGAFTGEDERFAYKRGVSRLWELCSAQWHARTGDWWRPLPINARHWEGGEISRRLVWKPGHGITPDGGEGVGESVEVEEPAGLAKWRIEWLKKKE